MNVIFNFDFCYVIMLEIDFGLFIIELDLDLIKDFDLIDECLLELICEFGGQVMEVIDVVVECIVFFEIISLFIFFFVVF